jgi:outer membrane protein assembly factor BamB
MRASTKMMNDTKARIGAAAVVAAMILSGTVAYGVPGTDGGDWPMWGGSPDRNMVSSMTGLPSTWDVASGENVRWVAPLGSQTYGNPVVANGKVFVGTNNEAVHDPDRPGDAGVLVAFDEDTGEFLWQHFNDKLAAGRVHDWPYQGVCSSPMVEGDRLYYVSNRGVLVALDTEGFLDGENDGLVTDEELQRPIDADIVWEFDMMEELGSFPHNMSNSSPVSMGNLLFVSTSNGQDESHVNIPSPLTPGIVAIDKVTGELVWEDNSVFDRILHGQWSSAAVGDIGGVAQVVMGQGDGWVRGYDAMSGEKLWEFDTNPAEATWPRTRNNVISTPVIWESKVYIANGQDPEHGEGVGHFYAIDGTQRGDITESGRLWHYDAIRRSISTAAIHDGLVYMPDFSGFLHVLDAMTGEVKYVHDTFAAVWSSPLVADGKVYLGDEDGDVVILAVGPEENVIDEINMGSSVYSSAVPANGRLIIATRNQLYSLEQQ